MAELNLYDVTLFNNNVTDKEVVSSLIDLNIYLEEDVTILEDLDNE